MNISVLGCGRWGSFHAWYAESIGHRVSIWGRRGSRHLERLSLTRENDFLRLPEDVTVTDSLEYAVSFADIIIIAISAQGLRYLCRQISHHKLIDKTFVLCMKGLEAHTGKRLSRVLYEELGDHGIDGAAVWLGPGHVQELIRGVPNCMVIDSDDVNLTKHIVCELGGDLIRFYYGQDLIGNEIGAAAKNVIGIAAGMLDGLSLSSLKGALMSRGAREIARLIKAMGGNELTAYGLCHLGDYEATLFSHHSNNRRFGEALVRGEVFDKLAEGVTTLEALRTLSLQYRVDLPISDAVYSIVIRKQGPHDVLRDLFLRPTKFEF